MRVNRLFIPVTLVMTLSFQGCISPLVPDKHYPVSWGNISTLGAECKAIEGTYQNAGFIKTEDAQIGETTLTSLLLLPLKAQSVSLYTHTRRLDSRGDAFVTLRIVPDEQSASYIEFDDCFCVKENLVCPGHGSSHGASPVGIVAGGSNFFFSVAEDRSLIVKRDDVAAGLILIVPFRISEKSWGRFLPVKK